MRTKVRGRVFHRGRGTWAYEVLADDVVVLADNTGSWKIIFDACVRSVAAVDRVTNAGHHLKSYASLMGSQGAAVIGDPDGLCWYSPAYRHRDAGGRAGWYLAGVHITDEDVAALVEAGRDVQRDVSDLIAQGDRAVDLVLAVSSARA
jgi:hypothetical protein